MLKIHKELLRELQKLQEKADEKEENIMLQEELNDLMLKILKEEKEKIIKLAYENAGGSFSGNVYININNGQLVGKTLSSNNYIVDNDLIKIYSLNSNWLANAIIEVNDILTDEEWEKLENKYNNQANYLDRKQLKEIGVNLDERLKELLAFWIDQQEEYYY